MKIIASGSSGNCVKISDRVIVDIGVKISDEDLAGVTDIFITHVHADHINPSVYNHLLRTTTIKFWSVSSEVLEKFPGVRKFYHIDVMGDLVVQSFKLQHDCECHGIVYDDLVRGIKGIYATDFGRIEDLPEDRYDEILIEGNYFEESEREERIRLFHNSVEDAQKFILLNLKRGGEYKLLHQSDRI